MQAYTEDMYFRLGLQEPWTSGSLRFDLRLRVQARTPCFDSKLELQVLT